MKKIKLLDVFVCSNTKNEVLTEINSAIFSKNQLHITGVNASKIIDLQSNNFLRDSVLDSDIIIPDGQSIIWASKILKTPLIKRIAGIDLMDSVIKLAYDKKYTIFFFGAKEEVVKKVIDKYTDEYSKDIIAGFRNGYFLKEDESSIIEQINNSNAQILFVAMTTPKQELFIYNNKKKLKNIYYLTEVGGSFDVISGLVKRAPIWMQNAGLEWFYRFLQEPKRMWKRYLVGNTKFIWLVLKEKFNIK